MNGLEYYTRQKEAWTDKELQDVKTEYETNEMTVSEIADIHRRTPGSIGYKLVKLGLISHYMLSRGYTEYKSSRLYKEIILNDVNRNRDSKVNTNREKTPPVKQNTEISAMRKDIDELKKDVKEMLRLMNAVYDFESQ